MMNSTESSPAPTYEELEQLVRSLRAEVLRLREELRRLNNERHEVPPHYR